MMRGHTELRGPWAWLMTGTWLAVVATAVTVTTMGFISGFKDPSALQTPQVESALHVLGIPVRVGMAVALVLPFVLFVVAAGLVFWRRPADWMALLFVGTLVCLQAFTSVAIVSVLERGGVARLAALAVLQLSGIGIVAVLFLFPNGHPYPSWAVVVAPVLAAASVASSAMVESMALIRPERDLGLRGSVGAAVFGLVMVVGTYAQFRRYREVSTETERQQAKWVMFPFAAAAGLLLVGLLLPEFVVDVSDRWTGWVMVSVIPLGVAFPVAVTVAILRYRLYDIDVVISKTLVFAGLAAFMTAMYLGVVVGIGTLLGVGEEGNVVLAIVVTAVVAVAFQPARVRLTRAANRLVFGQRATPYEVLSQFASHLGETVTNEETLERMARLLTDGTRAARTEVDLWIDDAMRPVATAGEDRGLGEPWRVEVTHDGELLGALMIAPSRGDSLTSQDRLLVEHLAAQAGLGLRNVRLTTQLTDTIEQLRASRKRLVAAQDEERRRLERDLHDGAQQQFIAVKIKAAMAKQLSERGRHEQANELIDQVITATDEGVQALRELAHGIYPPLLEAQGLPSALAARTAKAPVAVTIQANGIGRYPREVEAAVYFCVLEALQNVTKYADASQVTVDLTETNACLRFTVQDDGRGFDVPSRPSGRGLSNMADRLEALSGELQIRSAPGEGTTATGLVPVPRDAAESASGSVQ